MAEQVDPGSEIVLEAEETPKGGGAAGMVKRIAKIALPAVLIPLILSGVFVYMQYETVVTVGMTLGLDFGTEDAEEVEEPVAYGEFMQIDGMIINPAASNGKRYLLVSLGLESLKPSVLEEVKQKEVVVRDAILKVLGNRTVDELADINQRNVLKDEVREAINEILGDGGVERMYFTQYVLQ